MKFLSLMPLQKGNKWHQRWFLSLFYSLHFLDCNLKTNHIFIAINGCSQQCFITINGTFSCVYLCVFTSKLWWLYLLWHWIQANQKWHYSAPIEQKDLPLQALHSNKRPISSLLDSFPLTWLYLHTCVCPLWNRADPCSGLKRSTSQEMFLKAVNSLPSHLQH